MAASLQNAVDRICDDFGGRMAGCGPGFAGDDFLDKSSDLHTSRLQQSGCFVGDVDSQLHGFSICRKWFGERSAQNGRGGDWLEQMQEQCQNLSAGDEVQLDELYSNDVELWESR